MTKKDLEKRIKILDVTPEFLLPVIYFIDELERLHKVFKALPDVEAPRNKNAKLILKDAFASPKEVIENYVRIYHLVLLDALSKELKEAPAGIKTMNEFIESKLLSGEDFVAGFYRRYPLMKEIIGHVSANAIENMQTIARNIVDDFGAIKKVFGINIEKLKKIKTSGNDLHKGGKQVMFLTFGTLSGQEVKVVYKPSDIEFDCLLLGNSEVLNKADSNFFKGSKSFYELLEAHMKSKNELKNKPYLKTYKFLPRYYGSSLRETFPRNIRDSYGYMEYLSTDEYVEPTQKAWYSKFLSRQKFYNAYKNQILRPDMNEKKIAGDFYYQIGQMTLIGLLFSMTDGHQENILVHGYEPYFIDLENSMFRLVNIDASGLGKTNMYDSSIGAVSTTSGKLKDKIKVYSNRNRKEEWSYEKEEEIQKYEPCRLRLSDGRTPVDFNQYWEQIFEGFQDLTLIIKDINTKPDFVSWKERLKGIIVRHVILDTLEFNNTRKAFLNPDILTVSDRNKLERSVSDFLYDSTSYAFKVWAVNSDLDVGLTFMGNYPDDVKVDYLNFDIPVFYAPVNRNYLLNSMGDKVSLPAKIINFKDPQTNENMQLDISLEAINKKLKDAGLKLRTKPDEYLSRIPFDHFTDKLSQISGLADTSSLSKKVFEKVTKFEIKSSIANLQPNEVFSSADALFNTPAFRDRNALAPVKNSDFSITVKGNTIPLVSEWTKGESSFLVFNELNSCLGLIGISPDKTKLRGAHFSVDFDQFDNLNSLVNDVLTNYFDNYTTYSFGDSQNEWIHNYRVEAIRSVRPLDNDENEKNWFFSIKDGSIVAEKWKSK